jgi:cytochrome c556
MAFRFRAVVFGMAALALAAAGVTAALAQASGEQAVKERSDLMKSFNDSNKIVAAAVKSGEIDAKVIAAAEQISTGARKIPALFPEGTGDDKLRTRAKAVLWQEKPKFEANAKDLETAFAEVATAAKAGDKAGVEAGFKKGNDTCNACHKDYRGPQLK